MGLDHSPVTKVTCIMKCFIVVAAFVALACGQQTPDERRKELVDNAWSIASENGCFTRQTSQDLFNTLDGNGVNKVFDLWKPDGDCVSEANFKSRATMLLQECR